MVERKLVENGKFGSKMITFPKTILQLADMENEKKVLVDVSNGMIIIRKVN